MMVQSLLTKKKIAVATLMTQEIPLVARTLFVVCTLTFILLVSALIMTLVHLITVWSVVNLVASSILLGNVTWALSHYNATVILRMSLSPIEGASPMSLMYAYTRLPVRFCPLEAPVSWLFLVVIWHALHCQTICWKPA